MDGLGRRQLLTTALKGLGVGLAGLLPGGLWSGRKAFAQAQRTSPTTLSPAEISRLSATLAQTTRQNVIQVLKTADLPPEDRLAVLSVRQLSPDQVRESLARLESFSGLARRDAGAGDRCGSNCGDGCGGDCGHSCGFTCNHKVVSGGFCGGACTAQASTIGVVDVQGRLGINFRLLDAQRFSSALHEAQRLIR